MHVTKSHRNRRRAGLIVAVAALAAAAAILAERPSAPSTASTKSAGSAVPAARLVAEAPAAPAAAPAAAPVSAAPALAPATAGGLRAYIDPATGQLREPEQDDLAATAVVPQLARRAAPFAFQDEGEDIPVAGGGVARALGDDSLVFAIATIGPDGKVKMEHAQGAKAASARVEATNKKAAAPAGEASNDR